MDNHVFIPVITGVLLPLGSFSGILVRQIWENKWRLSLLIPIICLGLFTKMYEEVKTVNDRSVFIISLSASAMLFGIANSYILKNQVYLLVIPVFGLLIWLEYKLNYFSERKWKKEAYKE